MEVHEKTAATSMGSGSDLEETGLDYSIKLPIFEGPMDLLLHLIRQNEVEITEIPIALIADQYVETLGLMEDLNLEGAAEYLVLAATVAWIKSRMLLPITDGDEEDEGVDPRAELIARLLEYQRFKDVAEELGERPVLGRDIYRAWPEEIALTPEAEKELEVDALSLVVELQRVLNRSIETAGVHQVTFEDVSIHSCMVSVMEVLEISSNVDFESVLTRNGAPLSRAVIVGMFLAVLELVRIEAIRIYQGVDDNGSPKGQIHLRKGVDGIQDWREKISEWM